MFLRFKSSLLFLDKLSSASVNPIFGFNPVLSLGFVIFNSAPRNLLVSFVTMLLAQLLDTTAGNIHR